MDGENVKNDIKTIFVIINTFNAIVSGLFPLSVCVAQVLSEGFNPIVSYSFGFGATMSALAALGYYAAFKDNKKTLYSYSAMMGLVSALEVAGVTLGTLPSCPPPFMIFVTVHIGITLAALSLACALAKRSCPGTLSGPAKSSRGSCLYKCLGCGALFVLVILYSIKFI